MNTNKLKLTLLCVILLAPQCRAAIFEAESLRPSKIVSIKSATYESRSQFFDITREVALKCTGKYVCKVNLHAILGKDFITPYDFIVDYSTTRHSVRHKEKLSQCRPTVTIKGVKSHLGTVTRWLGMTVFTVATLL